MEYTAEDLIKLIEQGRFDKIGPWALKIIAKKYRRLDAEGQKLPIQHVNYCCCSAQFAKPISATEYECVNCGKEIQQ